MIAKPNSSIQDTWAGVFYDIPAEEYHQRELGVASKSTLDLVHHSPAHYYAWLQGLDKEPTPALEFGAAFHCASLEPERFARDYAIVPNFGDCRFKEA